MPDPTPKTEQNSSSIMKNKVPDFILPLAFIIIIMPLLAWGVTEFLIIPRIKAVISEIPTAAAPVTRFGKSVSTQGKGTSQLQSVQFNKIIVNVAGSMGRYILASLTVAGDAVNFKEQIESRRDMIVDLIASVLSTKSLSDLEKPGARNLIRSELLTTINNSLGSNLVKEIYITEFTIQ